MGEGHNHAYCDVAILLETETISTMKVIFAETKQAFVEAIQKFY